MSKRTMRVILYCILVLYSRSVYGHIRGLEKINNQIIIEDFEGAAEEISGLLQEGSSYVVFSSALKIYSALGREKAWKDLWRQGEKTFSREELFSRNLLEDFCWGILKKGFSHSSGYIRGLALISAMQAKDLRAEKYVVDALRDDDLFVRSYAIRSAKTYATPLLKQHIIALLKKKNIASEIKIELLKSIGDLKIISEKHTLNEVLKDRYASNAEKRTAVHVLLSMNSLQNFSSLFNKDVLDTRNTLIICALIHLYRLCEYKDLLITLALNSCPDVQNAALSCLMSFDDSIRGNADVLALCMRLLNENYSLKVRFSAAKLLLLSGLPEGEAFFEKALTSSEKLIIREAAGVLLSAGSRGLPLAHRFFLEVSDEEASVDLSLLLLLRREEQEKTSKIISNFLKKRIEKPITRGLELLFCIDKIPQNECDVFEYSRYLQVSTHLFRLLSLSDHPCDRELLPLFLEHKWKQGFSCFIDMFSENQPQEIMSLLSSLAESPSRATRLEAILFKISLLRNEDSIEDLEKIYSSSSWLEKMKILDAVTCLDDQGFGKISFLLKRCFEEDMLSLKILAANSLLTVLQ